MPALAAAGYHVIAPDQRGYGRTTGWDADYDGDLAFVPAAQSGARRARAGVGVRLSLGRCRGRPRFRQPGRGLVRAGAARRVPIGRADERAVRRPAAAAVRHRGHAASAAGATIPCIASSRRCRGRASIINGTTRRARPTPTCTARRRACMISCAPTTITRARTGKTTSRIRCKAGPPSELAKMPTYYVMDLAKNMAETVAEEMPISGRDRGQPMAARPRACVLQRRICAAPDSRAACNGIAAAPPARSPPSCEILSGRTIDVPSCFISGKQDWGTYQRPGVFEAMQTTRLHADARLPSGRRRRPLGAAGAAGARSAACCCNSCGRRRTGKAAATPVLRALRVERTIAIRPRCSLSGNAPANDWRRAIWERRSPDCWERWRRSARSGRRRRRQHRAGTDRRFEGKFLR